MGQRWCELLLCAARVHPMIRSFVFRLTPLATGWPNLDGIQDFFVSDKGSNSYVMCLWHTSKCISRAGGGECFIGSSGTCLPAPFTCANEDAYLRFAVCQEFSDSIINFNQVTCPTGVPPWPFRFDALDAMHVMRPNCRHVCKLTAAQRLELNPRTLRLNGTVAFNVLLHLHPLGLTCYWPGPHLTGQPTYVQQRPAEVHSAP